MEHEVAELNKFLSSLSQKVVIYDPLDRELPPPQQQESLELDGLWNIKRDQLLKLVGELRGIEAQ